MCNKKFEATQKKTDDANEMWQTKWTHKDSERMDDEEQRTEMREKMP